MLLTSRQINIIEFLYNRTQHVTYDDIAKELNVSVRTIRNDIDEITLFLSMYNIKLERKPSKGIMLLGNINDINLLLDEINKNESRVLSNDERTKIIILYLLYHMNSTYQKLADLCGVSKQTIINHFDDIDKYLLDYDIKVARIKKMGIHVFGDETSIRRCLLNLSNDDNFVSYMEQIVDDEKVNENVNLILDKLKVNCDLNYANKARLSLLMNFILKHIKNGYIVKENSFNINKTSKIYERVNESLKDFISLSQERNYISIILLSERMLLIPEMEMYEDDEAADISNKLIQSLIKTHEIKEGEIVDIQKALTIHIRSAIYRCRNNISIKNELLEQIKISISLIYEFTRRQLKSICHKYGICFDENEIAYIAMYIASIFECSTKKDFELQVLLVCSFGLATGSILKTRILQAIPECNIVGPFSHDQAYEYLTNHQVDLVVSTNEFIYDEQKVIIVNPLVNQNDIEKIRSALFQYSYSKMCSYFINSYADIKITSDLNKHYLKDYISKEYINITSDDIDWEKSIRLAAKPLVDSGKISETYVDKMVRAVWDYGTYMVMTPFVAYVHAGVDDGIYEDCTSMLVLDHDISFGEKNQKQVCAIVVLGVHNKEDTDLFNIAYILDKQRNVDIIKRRDVTIKLILNMHD